jgi:hypothetical protein
VLGTNPIEQVSPPEGGGSGSILGQLGEHLPTEPPGRCGLHSEQ